MVVKLGTNVTITIPLFVGRRSKISSGTFRTTGQMVYALEWEKMIGAKLVSGRGMVRNRKNIISPTLYLRHQTWFVQRHESSRLSCPGDSSP